MNIVKGLGVAIVLPAAFAVSVFGQGENAEHERVLKLTTSVPAAYRAGNTDRAAAMANELLALAPKFPADWNYGNAMHTAHLVLGHIAFDAGDMTEAKRQLLASVDGSILPYGLRAKNEEDGRGQAKASPQMDSFGPDMSLASDLLSKGESETVLKYFDLCAKFWSMDEGRLAEWRRQIAAGEKPDFGPNLVYFFGK